MTAITEHDLQTALQKQMRRAHDAAHAQRPQPDEFTVMDYLAANQGDKEMSYKVATTELRDLLAAGAVTVREGVANGRRSKLYKFTA